MGQKVHPTGIRLGITKDWSSKWFASKKNYADYLNADIQVRDFLNKKLKGAYISQIEVERPNGNNAKVIIHSARPGVIIGKKGSDVETLRNAVSTIMKVPVHLTIKEVRKPELDARLVAENVAQQLQRRVMFRRVMKRTIQSAMRQGAEGIKISLSGRLSGAEIARTEHAREGRVPLHTFRANIDFNTAEALTTYGIIALKIWIFKGEIHDIEKETLSQSQSQE